MKNQGLSAQRRIYSVSELTKDIKHLLENEYPLIWVSGEVSNYRTPVSGHGYFTLKDEHSQIQCVIFRSQRGNLSFSVTEGMFITGLGRLSVYEPRGSYQIIFEHLEPGGIGAMQVAFEQLKNRLHLEGLFDEKHKRPIPYLPGIVTVITSPTGAAVRDIIQVIQRRFPNMPIDILPVKVQGQHAAGEIVNAIQTVSELDHAEVVILARGGGSFEDLQPFNSERVARAIYHSTVPVVSAIGHETDFTIADFVSDLRAPTPSAAAELVVPVKAELEKSVREHHRNLVKNMATFVGIRRENLIRLAERIADPRRRYQDFRLRLDEWSERILRASLFKVMNEKNRLIYLKKQLISNSPFRKIDLLKQKLRELERNILLYSDKNIDNQKNNLLFLETKLAGLSPLNVLARGYSITRTFPEGRVVRSPAEVNSNQLLEIIVEKGNIVVKVDSDGSST